MFGSTSPNLDRQCLSYFLKFSAEFRKENYKFYEIAPLQYVHVLSPWNNLITEDQSFLDKLSNLVIESKDMDCSTFYFRKHWSLGTSQKQCQLVHFNPKKIYNTGHDVYLEDLKALSEKFNKCASLDSKYQNLTVTWKLGECFFLSLLKPDEDNMIAFIQFKRLDDPIFWVNCLKVQLVPGFEKEDPVIGIGIGLLLLRSLQLYQCCLKQKPNIMVHTEKDSRLHKYYTYVPGVLYEHYGDCHGGECPLAHEIVREVW